MIASVLREARFVSGEALTALGARLAGRRGGWARRFSVAAALLLLVAVAGDRWALTSTPTGIDPLEVLDIQVRPNAYVILDSSGSMRERPDAVDNPVDGSYVTPAEGEITGDDPTSKLYQAKQVLESVVQANQDKVSFRFGRYLQDAASYGPERNNRFVYTTTCATTDATCNGAVASLVINPGGNGATAPGLKRSSTDQHTASGVTTYHLFAGRFWNGETVSVLADGSTASS